MSFVAIRVRIAEKSALKGLEGRVEKAIAFGLNNGGRLVFTQVRRALWKKIGSKAYATVTKRTYAMPAHAGAGLMTFTIVAKGKPIPIKEFPVRRVAHGVQASPWATARVFARSFQEKTPGGGFIPGDFRARRGEAREPIRKLLGPNLAKELLGVTRSDRTIPDVFYREAAALVPPAIMKGLAKALGV